jgi:hypothetical protein
MLAALLDQLIRVDRLQRRVIGIRRELGRDPRWSRISARDATTCGHAASISP